MYARPDGTIASINHYTSSGIRSRCGTPPTKAGMSRHLGSCLAEHEHSQGKVARLIRLRIEDAYSPIFWMDVEMKATATLEKLDDFLRGEWLECCGHLSDFEIDGTTYTVANPCGNGPLGMFAGPYERTMKVKVGGIL